jgi:hypothetical protein
VARKIDIDLTGKRFGHWVVRAYAGRAHWSCLCDCGALVDVRGTSLREGRSKSCGCRLLIDLTGKRFGRWTVTAYAQRSRWSCVCDCGARVIVDGGNLRSGGSRSCGCLARELSKARATTHGMTGSPEYISWQQMKQRCLNPRHHAYKWYGGAGVTMREEWINSFVEFFADRETRPPGTSLDRIDPAGNYEPGNTRWAPSYLQAQNKRPRRVRTVKRRKPPPLDDPPF